MVPEQDKISPPPKSEKSASEQLLDATFESFSVESVVKAVRATKCNVVVLSQNKFVSQQRAKMVYSSMARQIVYPHYHMLIFKNGAKVKFIVDYDELGDFEPDRVFE